MFGKTFTLFEIFRFKIRINIGWAFLALLIAWSLAVGFFPSVYEGLPEGTYWSMAIAGVVGLFFSIVFHELSHSLVARQYGTEMRGITLFLFGGAAEMDQEPSSPKAEFLMAIAGPISSLVLAGAFHGIYKMGVAAEWPEPVSGVIYYLGLLNLILAVFNMLPAFPMDGGRALRAIIWHYKNSLKDATRLASRIGAIFGFVLMGLAVLNVIAGNFVGGIWWFLLGMFLRAAAVGSYRQLETRRMLEGETVRRFMTANPTTVTPNISVRELVENHMYREHHKLYPVLGTDGALLGYVSPKQVKGIDRKDWDRTRVDDIYLEITDSNTIDADLDAIEALSRMQRENESRLLVTSGGKLVGILTLKDIMRLLELRVEFDRD